MILDIDYLTTSSNRFTLTQRQLKMDIFLSLMQFSLSSNIVSKFISYCFKLHLKIGFLLKKLKYQPTNSIFFYIFLVLSEIIYQLFFYFLTLLQLVYLINPREYISRSTYSITLLLKLQEIYNQLVVDKWINSTKIYLNSKVSLIVID